MTPPSRCAVEGVSFALWAGFLLLLRVSDAWAAKPTALLSEGVRVNFQSESNIPTELTTRAELQFEQGKRWRLIPFAEERHDLDEGRWSRVELGGEIGFNLTSWAYLGNGFHRAWVHPGDDRMEWEVRPVFTFPIPQLKVRSEPVKIYALNEYTYDLDQGTGIRNEVSTGIKIPLPISRLILVTGWRHVDQVHGTDSDQFEGLLHLAF